MTDTKKIVYAIMNFLNVELQNESITEECREGLEVAIQCLETSFGVSTSDQHLDIGTSLAELFRNHCSKNTSSQAAFVRAPEATPQQKEDAEKLKNEGNIAVHEERIQDAVDKYTQAIALDGNNPALYSNRAAAHNKLGNFSQAVTDAETALAIDPSYTKALGRIATAYIGLNRLPEAQTVIKRALEQEPNNESYLNNLRAIEARLSESDASVLSGGASGLAGAFSMMGNAAAAGGGAGGGGGAGMPGFPGLENLMSNPALMQMATQMMQQPAIQQIMTSMMGGAAPPAPAGQQPPQQTPASDGSTASGPGVDASAGFQAMLQAGQQMAEQMRSANPELMEQLRRQMGQFDPSSANPDSS